MISCKYPTVLHLLQWQRTFLFRSSSNLSSILYILTGKEGTVCKTILIFRFSFSCKSPDNFFLSENFVPTLLKSQQRPCKGSRTCSKLDVQITYESLKGGCAKSANYLIETQKVDAQMLTLTLPLHCMMFVSGAVEPVQN